MIKDICTNCPYRDKCKRPCTRVIGYIEQDYIGIKESMNPEGDVSEVYANTVEQEWPELVENIHLTPREKEIVTLLGKGLNRADVSQVLDISRESLRKHLSRMRKKLIK